MSADIAPLTAEALLALPAPGGAEFRSLVADSTVVTAAAAPPIQRSTELVFIDPRVPDRERLLAELISQSAEGRHFEIVTLDVHRDGIAQVTETLAGRIQIDAIHFISHGTDGAVQLGRTWLDAKTLGANADTVASWGESLKHDADLLFYGCDLAASARGRALVEWIAELTKADLAASTDATGGASAGGDWDLEATVGVVETALVIDPLARETWSHRLGAVAVGLDFPVNSPSPSVQTESAVARDATGNFVVAWQSKDQDGDNWGIYAQRFNASGAPQGGEFRVNTNTSREQEAPVVAMDDSGNFVVAWQSKDQDGDNWGIYAQRFNASGAPQGGEFRVNTATSKEQQAPSVAMDAGGNFVVAWQSKDQDGDNWGIYAQRFNASGAPQGGEFRVNTYDEQGTTGPVRRDGRQRQLRRRLAKQGPGRRQLGHLCPAVQCERRSRRVASSASIRTRAGTSRAPVRRDG